jgi:uncharacterized protein (TIGR00369 family)
MTDTPELADAPELHPPDRHSPFHRVIGWKVTEWGDGSAVITCPVRADFMNRGGNLHGGFVATLIDAAAGYAALGGPSSTANAPGSDRGPAGATLSLTINYLGTTREGLLSVRAVRTGGGKSIAFVRIEVMAESGAVIAEGVCTYRLFPTKA